MKSLTDLIWTKDDDDDDDIITILWNSNRFDPNPDRMMPDCENS